MADGHHHRPLSALSYHTSQSVVVAMVLVGEVEFTCLYLQEQGLEKRCHASFDTERANTFTHVSV